MTDSILGRVMLAFDGDRLPADVDRRLADAPAAGMTVFRHHNVRSADQVRALTEAFQAAGARGGHGPAGRGSGPATLDAPLLVAADQEGGQLIALGDATTAFAGNLALGAIDDEALTERVGRATGLEARALGVNVVYAPVLDLATDPGNPALGVRSFGDDPTAVARHGRAMVRGLQSAGVAATVKHAPGMGHARADPHHELAAIEAERSVLEEREFVPFRAAIDAGARLAMIGHLAVPTVTGRADLPATLARAIVTDLLRHDFGFEGVTISDALDMHAIAQGEGQASAVVEAIRAGIDLLLTTPDPGSRVRIEAALVRAATNGAFDAAEVRTGDARLASLRSWLGAAGPLPDLSVVRHADHLALAREVAERAVTLVRDPGRIVGGLSPDADDPRPVLAIMPRPIDLTPADTSSTVPAGLAVALRRYHRAVEEIVVDPAPDQAAIDAVRGRVAGSRAVVVGTLDAIRHPGQVALVEAIAAAAVGSGISAVAVALRGPWDVAAYPGSMAALATYSILPDSLAALAAVLAGASRAGGRLPVALAR